MTASTGGRDGRAQDAEQRNCSSNTDEDELELECSTNYRDPAIHLTRDQLGKPTAELFEAKHLENPQDKSDIANFTGKWGHLRTKLDYTYHKVPSKRRQLLQDSLIEDILQIRTNECRACHEDHEHPQVLFTAGAMASGKGHTLRHFLKEGEISLPSNFIWVDPDKISRQLPERQQYLEHDHNSASAMLHPESAMLQEILGRIARERRQSLVVDGSLSDGKWFKQVMKEYRDEGFHLEIFFVFADEDVMEKRAEQRAKKTGRHTGRKHIERSARDAPQSVQELANRDFVDRVRMIDNSSDEKPPHLVYDSKGDACFEKEGKSVDVWKWVNKEKQKGKEQKSHM